MAQTYEHDISLIQRAARGDGEAFSQLFDNHYRAVYEYCLFLAGDADLAEDITQETFIRAHKNLHRLGPPWKIRAWLCRLARNLYIDHYRQQPFTETLDPEGRIASTDTDPEGKIVHAELSDPIKEALGKLSPNHREALLLRELGGFQYAEIAEVMNTSLDNVKVLIHRARSSFKDNYSLHLLAEEPLPRCDELADLLDAWHDGEISGDKETLVREHIKQCETCQQRRRELAALLLLLRGLRLPYPSPELKTRVLRGTNGQPQAHPEAPPAPKPKSSSPLPAIIGMGIFLALALAIYFFFGMGGFGGGGEENDNALVSPPGDLTGTPGGGGPVSPVSAGPTATAPVEGATLGLCSAACTDSSQCGVVDGVQLACFAGVCWDAQKCDPNWTPPVEPGPSCPCTCVDWVVSASPPACKLYQDCNGLRCTP